MMDKDALLLGALLHDIGKFWQRVDARPRMKHEQYSAVFFEELFKDYFTDYLLLRDMVLNHHAPKNRAEEIIQLSDWLSSSERETEEREHGSPTRSPLLSVMSRIEVDEWKSISEKAFKLNSLSLAEDVIFPIDNATVTPDNYKELWDRFTEEFSCIGEVYQSSDFATIYYVLRKYTTFIPSATPWEPRKEKRTVPDISLFEHLKTTCAIAACLDEQLTDDELKSLIRKRKGIWDKPICLLVKGDISGVQNFIYTITAKGAAKGLRGRSFYLQLLSESIAKWLLRNMKLPPANLLYVGGGHFYILLPLCKREYFQKLKIEISRKLLQCHKGLLYLAIGETELSANDFQKDEFPAKWMKASEAVTEAKHRKWSELPTSEMFHQFFRPREMGGVENVCDVCKNEGKLRPDEDGNEKCDLCRSFENLGELLRDAEFLVEFNLTSESEFKGGGWGEVLNSFGVHVELVNNRIPSPPTSAEQATIFRLLNTDFLNAEIKQLFNGLDIPKAYGFKFVTDVVPKINGKTADFDHLAKAAKGAKWLGVLRMDVDNLGKVFGQCETISRTATLSFLMSLFFEGWLVNICREFNKSDVGGVDSIYGVYAGGDDLFIVGAWDRLPQLAHRIREDFRKFVGGEHITISAGIAIEHPKFPLYKFADNAKIALDDMAKEVKREADGKEKRKDAVCFMSKALSWDDFDKVQRMKQLLYEMIEEGINGRKLARGILSKLDNIYQLFSENEKRKQALKRNSIISMDELNQQIMYANWRWRLVYNLKRAAEAQPEFSDKLEQLLQMIVDGKFIKFLNIPVRWVELLTKK